MALDPNKWRLSEAANQAIFDRRIKPQILMGAFPQENPVVVFLGGQPGAGKSPVADAAVKDFADQGGCVQIAADDYREKHPEHHRLMHENDKIAAFYTGPDAGRWVEKAIQLAAAHRLNVVLDGTMRSPETVAASMQTFRDAGYIIEARALAVNFKLSELGILQRYEGQKADRGIARMTTPEAHQAGYDGVPVTLERIEREKLADRVRLYQRGAVVLYENEQRNGEWIIPPRARAVLEHERTRPMSAAELRGYVEGYEALARAVMKEGRNATPQEISNITKLLEKARTLTPQQWTAKKYWNDMAAEQKSKPAHAVNQTIAERSKKPRI